MKEAATKPKVKIEFEDVISFLEDNDLSSSQCEKVYREIEHGIDLDYEIEFSNVEHYMEHNATTSECKDIYDLIKDEVPGLGSNKDELLLESSSVLDEMALDKIREFVQLNGIQALAEKL